MNASRLMFPSLLLCLLFAALTPAFALDTTYRVSIGSRGAQGTGRSHSPDITPDGRLVVFHSCADNFDPADTIFPDVFVRDRALGTTERLSFSSDGGQADSCSYSPVISDDGRFVAFQSPASNLVAGDTNGRCDVFVRDRALGTTERVSVTTEGEQGNGDSGAAAISSDGRYVAFESLASDLVVDDSNSFPDVFIRDRSAGETWLVSHSQAGGAGNGWSNVPSISADGRYVAFESTAGDLVPDDHNMRGDIFIWDLQGGSTDRVSLTFDQQEANGNCYRPSISADGRYVAFQSYATNLVDGDTNGDWDIFVRDRLLATTERVSLSSAGVQSTDRSLNACISPCGRYVAFESPAANLVADDSNDVPDVFVRDIDAETTWLASLAYDGVQSNGDSYAPSLATGAQFAAFDSSATNLVPGDTNDRWDIFVRGPLTYAVPQALLELHPNEQAPGVGGQLLGDPYWTAPGASPTGAYTWKTYQFAGSPYLWIQVCAQTQRASISPSGKPDRLQMLVDGVNLSDYWADNMAAPPNWQWDGSFALDLGRRKTLRFLSMGIPGVHSIRFKAVQYPIIWWIKVTDLEPELIEAPG